VFDNPIIHRQLTRTARNGMLYGLRAGLPAVALVALVVALSLSSRWGDVDWRKVAGRSHALASALLWTQFLVLSILAFVFAERGLSQRWERGTMELLCTTPLTARSLVVGEFLSAVVKVLFVSVALLPVVGVLASFGYLSGEALAASLAVVLGSVVLCAGFGVATSAARQLEGPWAFVVLGMLCFYGAGVLLLALARGSGSVVLTAICPSLALASIVDALITAPQDPWQLGLFSMVGSLCLSGVALAVAMLVFPRALSCRLEGLGRRRRSVSRGASQRPPLEPEGNPFLWQARTGALRAWRWALPMLTASVGSLLYYGWARVVSRGGGGGEAFAVCLLVLAGLVTFLFPLVYGVQTVAKEKQAGTAPLLLLTGVTPTGYFLSKIRAVYGVMKATLVLLALLLLLGPIGYRLTFGEDLPGNPATVAWYLFLVEVVVAGPAVGATIGLAFGVCSESARQAYLALTAALCVPFALMIVLSPPLAIMAFLALLAGLVVAVLRFATLAVLSLYLGWCGGALCLLIFSPYIGALGGLAPFSGGGLSIVTLLVGFVGGFCYVLSSLSFERGLSGDPMMLAFFPRSRTRSPTDPKSGLLP